MRRIISLGLLVCLFVAFAASTDAQIRFSVGPKLGINFGTMSYDPDAQNKSGRTAMMFGATAELMFSKMFGVQIEPGYAMKGNKFEGLITITDQNGQPLGQATVTATRGVNEIQFPILFKAKFLDGPVKPYALVGPNLGIVASANLNINITNVPQGVQLQQTTQDIDEKSNTSGMDFGIDFGGGAEFSIAKNIGITADIRYSLGLSNLDNTQVAQGQQVASRKTRGFQLQFGALFAI